MTEQKDLTVKQQILHTIDTLPDDMLTYLQKKLTLEFETRAASRATTSTSTSTSTSKPTKAQLRTIHQKNKKNPSAYNSNNLVSLRAINDPLHIRRTYYKALIKQDWSAIYPSTDDDRTNKFYVYAHVNPNKFSLHTGSSGGAFAGTPFYIGKGSEDKAFDLKRDQGHGKEIETYLSRGFSKKDIVNILYANLAENKAFELESKLIYFFGTVYEKHRRHTFLYNLDTPKTPDFTGAMIGVNK